MSKPNLQKTKSCINLSKPNLQKTESCINLSKPNLQKTESCINQTLNEVPMQEIFINLTCINWTPVYYKHKSLSHGCSVKTGYTVLLSLYG
jgi:hypothetical protein